MIRGLMNWPRMRLEVKGHANYDEPGKDIVCAAASMLTGALAGVLEDAQARGRTKFEWKEEGSGVVIWADPNMGSMNEIKSYFRMAVKGMKMVAEQYPKNVEMKEVR